MSTTTKPRLVYFDIKGRAEAIRLAFHYGGIEFEDVRVKGEEWAEIKASGKAPCGQLPFLEFADGYVLPQSHAILRYAGKLAGLYPEDALEAAKVDAALGTVEDVLGKVSQTISIQDQDEKFKARANLAANFLPEWLPRLDKLFENGFVLGEQMSITDLFAANVVEYLGAGILDGIPCTICDSCPNLKALPEKVKNHPKLKSYYE